MNNSLQRAHQWWATLDQTSRQRVRDACHSYLDRDLVESMANAGVPVVSDGRWSCVSVGPTVSPYPLPSSNSLEELSRITDGDSSLGTRRVALHRPKPR